MLLSSTGIKLRIYLRTYDGEDILVELERDDIEKAAMAKARVSEADVHPIKLLRFELAQTLSDLHSEVHHALITRKTSGV
ncbi:hypothetical protein SAMN05216350_103162 [Polaromonas sp. YR568]|uniref:hypothetical protein n=1 Tax=Polaromonas sp. YR568 TaxID=1855301 RepID=UPI0008F36254|nr:hypothetical protein [Polaromonas sp. YR568]SFU61736.1 hypothetical protein SAMN05216350_103162 [Polaromonas sp. YR568]